MFEVCGVSRREVKTACFEISRSIMLTYYAYATTPNSKLRCNNLTTCNVTVSKDLFGDPCEGTAKVSTVFGAAMLTLITVARRCLLVALLERGAFN